MTRRLTRLVWALQKSHSAASNKAASPSPSIQRLTPLCKRQPDCGSKPSLLQPNLPASQRIPLHSRQLLQQQTPPFTQGGANGGEAGRHRQLLIAGRQDSSFCSQSNNDGEASSAGTQHTPSTAVLPDSQQQDSQQQQQEQQQQTSQSKQDEATSRTPASSSSSGIGDDSDAGHSNSSKDPEHGPSTSSSHSATDSEPNSPRSGSPDSQSTASSDNSSSEANTSNSSSSSNNKENPLGLDSEEQTKELLVEWRIKTSEWYGSGLNYVVNSHLQIPNMSSWFHLYPPAKPPGLLSQLLFPKGSSYFSWVLKLQFKRSAAITAPILQTAHEDLQAEGSIAEFKQQLSMAITMVLQLYSQQDWQGLRPMVSAGLLESMQAAYDTQTEAAGFGVLSLQDVSVDIDKLDVVCAHAITAEQLAAVDEQRAKETAGTSSGHTGNSMWDVVYVYVESTWNATLQTTEGGAQNYSRPKSGHWAFCRGPVQFDEQVPADVPWFVLAWL